MQGLIDAYDLMTAMPDELPSSMKRRFADTPLVTKRFKEFGV
jgi:hypothetical protein